MGMRDYQNLKDLIIPEAQEKIMDIYCAVWEDCHNMGHCKDCPDRQMLKEKFSLLECFSLKYSRMLLEAGYAPVVHEERKFDDLEFDGVDEILKKHRAFVMARIDDHGCHIGTYKGLSLEADGDWIINVDVEGVSVTGQGDFAPVVHGYDVARCPSLFECSVCGWRDTDTLTGDTSTYNYCPNCGAKMDGDEHGTE